MVTNNSINVPTGAAGTILQGGGVGVTSVFSTAAYPSVATGTGTLLRADGTNWVASTTTFPNTFAQGDVLYGSATNVVSALTKDTNATRYISNTGSSNSPAWAQVDLSNGVTGSLPNGNLANSAITLSSGTYAVVTGSPVSLGGTATVEAMSIVKYIVNATANKGTHTTIAAAITAASSGDTIFITEGTYTENLTLKNGVNLIAFNDNTNGVSGNGNPTVLIVGKCIDNGSAVKCCISGVELKTNSDNLLSLTGASNITLQNCFLNCGTTAIVVNNASANLYVNNCTGDLSTTGVKLHTATAGNIYFKYCTFTNSGTSVTQSSCDGNTVEYWYCTISHMLVTSSGGVYNLYYSNVSPAGTNHIGLTTAGTGTSTVQYCGFVTGSVACISIGTGTTCIIDMCDLNTSSNPVTGAGTFKYGLLTFSGSGAVTNASSNSQVTTKLGVLLCNPIAMNIGGSGANLTASNGGIVYSTSSAMAILSGTATAGKALLSGSSTTPVWSTPTYPSASGSAGQILRSDGTNNVYTTATYPTTTTSQQLLYSTGTSVVGELTTANSKFPATNSSGTLAMRALSVVHQVFSASGTYTPTAGMVYCIIEAVGGGGGGGGANATGANQMTAGGGGGGGGYSRKAVSAATIGASQTVTVGAGGASQTDGGNTSVGSTIVSALGGKAGNGMSAGTIGAVAGGAGGSASSGDFNIQGGSGGSGTAAVIAGVGGFGASGFGGSTLIGGSCLGIAIGSGSANTNGTVGTGYGGGGSGGAAGVSQSSANGGAGSDGLVVVTEFVIA